jgi:hypothetical protein
MNGIVAKRLLALGLTGEMALLTGCYRNLVDPCYPERYEYMSRVETNTAFAPQVHNGRVLDQTVWNTDFETGTEKLTPGGIEHLARLARRRPCPDPVVYLQTAQDIPYDQVIPQKLAEERARLDGLRLQAIQNYLAQAGGSHPAPFQVVVHDPGLVDIAATPIGLSIQKMYAGSQGVLPTVGSGTSSAVATANSSGSGASSSGSGSGGGK